MSELPEGWAETTIGAIASVQLGKMLDKAKRTRGTRMRYLRNANVRWGAFDLSELLEMPFEDDELERFDVRRGDLFICEGGEPGRSAVWDRPDSPELKFQKALIRVRGHPSVVDSRWIMFALRLAAHTGELESYFTGSTIKHLPREAALRFRLRIPPFPEQRRIVEKVGALMGHILWAEDRLSFSHVRLRASKMSLLGAAFTGGLVDDTEHPLEYVPLNALAERFDYGTSAKSSRSGDVPVLRMGNIADGHIDWEDLVYTSDAEEIEKYALAPGDVLFNRTNSPELVGKTAVYRGERVAIHAGYLIRIRCGSELLPDFLNLCLNSPTGRNWCHGVKTDGVSQSNISAAKLKEFPVPAFPLQKQERVVKAYRELTRLADGAQRRVGLATARTTKLTQAILAKAFAGELVPTEAELARREGRSYEPATMLLDRILRETAMSNDAPRRRPARR